MSDLNNIIPLHALIERELFTIDSTGDYQRITESIICLANEVADYKGDSDNLWHIGEDSHASLDSMIVGAYWHYTEWHAGQWTDSYSALCALGTVFSPGMSDGPEPDTSEHDVYQALDAMATAQE